MWFQFVDISCKASTCVGTKAGTADRRRRPYYPNDSFGCHFLAIPIINIVRTSKKCQKHFDRKDVKICIKYYWRFEALMPTDCHHDLFGYLKEVLKCDGSRNHHFQLHFEFFPIGKLLKHSLWHSLMCVTDVSDALTWSHRPSGNDQLNPLPPSLTTPHPLFNPLRLAQKELFS